MKVGFLSNQLDNRGTGNALFEYAYYNEKILGNESIIYTFSWGNHHYGAYKRFKDYFPIVEDPNPSTSAVDVMYHIKSGEDDGIRFPNTRYAVHAVFHANQPHGDRYAAVSEWLGKRDSVPWVPHVVALPYHKQNLRGQLGIPYDAIVFGRHGGFDTFDIDWVWKTIQAVLRDTRNIFFVFMNTRQPEGLKEDPRLIFLPETTEEVYKRKFINTCDAMIHARGRGETFGISVGEFALLGKPVLTYGGSSEKAHLFELKDHMRFFYTNSYDLFDMIRLFSPVDAPAYTQYYPSAVMNKFKKVFLDE